MPWFFTVLLIATCAGTLAVTGYLLYRLFTAEPVTATPAVTEQGAVTPAVAEPGAAGASPSSEPSAAAAGAGEPSR